MDMEDSDEEEKKDDGDCEVLDRILSLEPFTLDLLDIMLVGEVEGAKN